MAMRVTERKSVRRVAAPAGLAVTVAFTSAHRDPRRQWAVAADRFLPTQRCQREPRGVSSEAVIFFTQ